MLVVRQCLCMRGCAGQGKAQRKDQHQHWRRFFLARLGENMSAQVDVASNMAWATLASVAVVLIFLWGCSARCISRGLAMFLVGGQGACSFQEARCHSKQGLTLGTDFSQACGCSLPVFFCISFLGCCSTALGTSMTCSRCVSNCVRRSLRADVHVRVVSSCARSICQSKLARCRPVGMLPIVVAVATR